MSEAPEERPLPAWKRLIRHPMGRWGGGILALALLLALLGPWLVTDTTPHANSMDLEHAAMPVGSSVSGPDGTVPHWLGTDRYGRDLYSRLVLGTRISLGVGAVAVALSLLIGVPIGALAGYYGGWVDRLLNGAIQVFWSIPTFLMVIALGFALGKGVWQVFVAVGLTMWVDVARLVRGQMLQIRSLEYIDAARVLGYPSWRILVVHALPQTVSALVVLSASQFASALLLESGLSFLGIGAQPPIPTWGGMIRDHYPYLLTGQGHLVWIPGVALALLVLGFMALGTALRDALDVRRLER